MDVLRAFPSISQRGGSESASRGRPMSPESYPRPSQPLPPLQHPFSSVPGTPSTISLWLQEVLCCYNAKYQCQLYLIPALLNLSRLHSIPWDQFRPLLISICLQEVLYYYNSKYWCICYIWEEQRPLYLILASLLNTSDFATSRLELYHPFPFGCRKYYSITTLNILGSTYVRKAMSSVPDSCLSF